MKAKVLQDLLESVIVINTCIVVLWLLGIEKYI
jgi:hypothetical protein